MTTGFLASDGSLSTSGDTIDSDRAWSQRFTGHPETVAPSVTGVTGVTG